MLSVYLTLSFRYLWRRWFYALLIVASIASGVCLLVATRVINQTMDRAAQTTATPMSGAVDLILTSGESPIDLKLAEELKIPGVPPPGRASLKPSNLLITTIAKCF